MSIEDWTGDPAILRRMDELGILDEAERLLDQMDYDEWAPGEILTPDEVRERLRKYE